MMGVSPEAEKAPVVTLARFLTATELRVVVTDLGTDVSEPRVRLFSVGGPALDGTVVRAGTRAGTREVEAAFDVPAIVAGGQATWWVALARDDDSFRPVPPAGFLRTPRRSRASTGELAFELALVLGDDRVNLEVEVLDPWFEVIDVQPSEAGATVRLTPSDERLDQVPGGGRLVERSDGRQVTVSVTPVEGGCTVDLDFGLVPTGGEVWDLFVDCGDVPIRCGWHLSGPERKKTAVRYGWVAVGGQRLRPYFTDTNVLSVKSQATAPESQASPSPPPAVDVASRAEDLPGFERWLWRTFLRGIELVVRAARRWSRRHAADPFEQVTFVIINAESEGGTQRTVAAQAQELQRRGIPVQLITVDRPEELYDPPVLLRPTTPPRVLVDRGAHARSMREPRLRDRVRDHLMSLPSVIQHEDERGYERFSVWHDLKLVRALLRQRRGVLIGTRAGLNTAVARFARPGVLRVGQEHIPVDAGYTDRFRRQHLAAYYPRLHGLGVLTQTDADAIRRLVGDGLPVAVFPNPLPEAPYLTSSTREPVIVAGGRLTRTKQLDRAIEAFAMVADRLHGWELRIYGDGSRRNRLMRSATELGLAGRVTFPGFVDDFPARLAEGSFFVLTSRYESFGMVLIEAKRSGLPVVSFDCPNGPAEIVRDGVDGFLVPADDVATLAGRMVELAEDAALRSAMGKAGAADAHRFQASQIVEDWSHWMGQLTDRQSVTPPVSGEVTSMGRDDEGGQVAASVWQRLTIRRRAATPINFYYTRSKNYAEIQRQLFSLIGQHLDGVEVSETRGERREDALNFALHVRSKNRHGRQRPIPADVLMSHGAADKRYLSLRDPSTGEPYLNGFQHVLVPGPWLKRKLLADPDIELTEDQIHLVGWPRLDPLVEEMARTEPHDGPLRVLWAPSHDFSRQGKGKVSLSTYPEFEPFIEPLKERFDVRVSLHPRNRDSKTPTEAGTLAWADVVISDFGTMVYEAWALGKPVVFPRWIVGERFAKYGKGTAEQHIHVERIGWHPDSFDELVDLLSSDLTLGPGAASFLEDYLPAEYLGVSSVRCATVLRAIAGDWALIDD